MGEEAGTIVHPPLSGGNALKVLAEELKTLKPPWELKTLWKPPWELKILGKPPWELKTLWKPHWELKTPWKPHWELKTLWKPSTEAAKGKPRGKLLF